MSKSIFLCASMSFYKDLIEIEKVLIQKGWEVYIPISAQVMKNNNDFNPNNFKDVYSYEEKQSFVRENFQTIYDSDALLVINGEKHGIKGYIGTSVLMEIGIAFYSKSKIYVLNQVDPSANYKDELDAFGAEYLDGDINKL